MQLVFGNGIQNLIKTSNNILNVKNIQDLNIPDDINVKGSLVSLEYMIKEKFFSICTIDNIMKSHNIHMRSDHYNFLQKFHCVNWGDISGEMKNYITAIIVKYLEPYLNEIG